MSLHLARRCRCWLCQPTAQEATERAAARAARQKHVGIKATPAQKIKSAGFRPSARALRRAERGPKPLLPPAPLYIPFSIFLSIPLRLSLRLSSYLLPALLPSLLSSSLHSAHLDALVCSLTCSPRLLTRLPEGRKE